MGDSVRHSTRAHQLLIVEVHLNTWFGHGRPYLKVSWVKVVGSTYSCSALKESTSCCLQMVLRSRLVLQM